MQSSPTNRVIFLDWLRGLAAIIMLQGHTFDAFARPEDRNGAAFIFSQFFGGEAAAIFLFLTGITYALGMNRREHLAPWQRVTAALRRARYLFLLAVLFRVQAWVFSYPRSHVSDLLKVDVLNLMGLTAAVLAVLALANGIDRVRWAALAGVAMAAAAPLISMLDAHLVPEPIRWYFVPSYTMFGMFPWGAYLAFGVAAGSMIPLVQRGAREAHAQAHGDAQGHAWNRVMQWAALCGFALVLAGQYFSSLPFSIYPKSEFWLNSPGLVACKLGVTFLLAAGAYLWTGFLSVGWSWVRQLGTTSLIVYWAHIELVYGRWFADYRQHLNAGLCLVISAALVVAMLGVSLAYTRVPWRKIFHRVGIPVRHAPAPVYTLPSHAPDFDVVPARRRAQ